MVATAGVGWRAKMSALRSSTATAIGNETVTSALEQIVKRLEALERRIARLEAAAGIGRGATRASNADAFRSDPRAADLRPARQSVAAPGEAPASARAQVPEPTPAPNHVSAADAPRTERLDRVPAAASDPFPDLSQLDEKLEPRRGPAEQVQEMVRIQLGLAEAPKPDDCADALAAAMTHSMMSRAGQITA